MSKKIIYLSSAILVLVIIALIFVNARSKYKIFACEYIHIAKFNSERTIMQYKSDAMKSLFGIIPNDGTTLEQLREERLSKYLRGFTR